MPTFIKLINIDILYFIFKILSLHLETRRGKLYKWTSQCQHGFVCHVIGNIFLLEYLHFLKETYYRRLWNALFHHRQTVLCFVWVEQRERRQPYSRKSGQHQIFSGKNSLLRGIFFLTFSSLQFVFILYLLVTTIILINLLIAMMSDTYQRIQVSWQKNNFLQSEKNIFFQQQSDMEWKFGRSKLITWVRLKYFGFIINKIISSVDQWVRQTWLQLR